MLFLGLALIDLLCALLGTRDTASKENQPAVLEHPKVVGMITPRTATFARTAEDNFDVGGEQCGHKSVLDEIVLPGFDCQGKEDA
ncbi:hypothetical protein C8J57DRAFT_1519774 [Mycena rebaudengoi]|nr:hypothetical protein C8J57DRAFT_1519774 [Mycena rebaudengoi]